MKFISMKNKTNKRTLVTLLFIALILLPIKYTIAQSLSSIEISRQNGIEVTTLNGKIKPTGQLPLVSFQIGDKQYTSLEAKLENGINRIPGVVEISWSLQEYSYGLKMQIKFRNISSDTVMLHNIVPFRKSTANV